MIKIDDGRAHELRVRGGVYRICSMDARDLAFYNNVLHLFDELDEVEAFDAKGELVNIALPAELEIRPVGGAEPEPLWTLWVTEAGAHRLTADEDASELRTVRGQMRPERLCPSCGRSELTVVVRADWLQLNWWCIECHYEVEAWPPPASA